MRSRVCLSVLCLWLCCLLALPSLSRAAEEGGSSLPAQGFALKRVMGGFGEGQLLFLYQKEDARRALLFRRPDGSSVVYQHITDGAGYYELRTADLTGDGVCELLYLNGTHGADNDSGSLYVFTVREGEPVCLLAVGIGRELLPLPDLPSPVGEYDEERMRHVSGFSIEQENGRAVLRLKHEEGGLSNVRGLPVTDLVWDRAGFSAQFQGVLPWEFQHPDDVRYWLSKKPLYTYSDLSLSGSGAGDVLQVFYEGRHDLVYGIRGKKALVVKLANGKTAYRELWTDSRGFSTRFRDLDGDGRDEILFCDRAGDIAPDERILYVFSVKNDRLACLRQVFPDSLALRPETFWELVGLPDARLDVSSSLLYNCINKE